jgi:hypothetical protein
MFQYGVLNVAWPLPRVTEIEKPFPVRRILKRDVSLVSRQRSTLRSSPWLCVTHFAQMKA